MELSEHDALISYAKMLNTLDVTPLEPLLADDFTYESQFVFQPLTGKREYLDYIAPKLDTIRKSNEPVFAEMGNVAAFGRKQPCVVVAQGDAENLVAIVLAKTGGGKIKRLDLCMVPSPNSAQRTGEYPK